MEQPWWKIALSYFFEWHIESAPSPINPHLYVSLSRGRYQLSTANAIYSYSDLYSNFRRTFARIPLDDLPVQNVLILGFGLGSIPTILEKRHQKNYHYTAIEIDESVIYLANKYTLPELNSSIELIAADAEVFVQVCQEQFDLICMDVFLDDVIPSVFQSITFLENVNRLLKPDGLLLYNCLAALRKDLQSTRYFYENSFKSVFPEATYLDVEGNWMLMNRNV